MFSNEFHTISILKTRIVIWVLLLNILFGCKSTYSDFDYQKLENITIENGLTFHPNKTSILISKPTDKKSESGKPLYRIFQLEFKNGSWCCEKEVLFSSQNTDYHPVFSPDEKWVPGTLLLGPFTSSYFDLDIATNYVLAMLLKRNLRDNQADQLPVVQIELNSEEFGEKLIIDNSEYTILCTDNNQFKIIYRGFSGYRAITQGSNVIDISTGVDKIPLSITYGSKTIELQ